MNKEKVKELINSKKGIYFDFFYKGLRNQNEYFSGRIVKTFPSIFIVETSDKKLKSFSYSDYIIGNLKIVTK